MQIEMLSFARPICLSFVSLMISLNAFAMGAAPMSAHFTEINDPETAQLTSLGIKVYYAKDPVEYDLNDVNHEHIHSDSLSLPEAIQVAKLIGNELSQYPADCLHQSELKKVLITSNMVRSYHLPTQDVVVPVTAAPIFGQGTMVYDDLLLRMLHFSPQESGFRFVLNIINHEYFHYLDYEMGLFSADPAWMKVNADSPVPYGNGGDFDRKSRAGVWDWTIVGYVDEYSESAMVEDRAEIFGGFTAHPYELGFRTVIDSIIAGKAALMRAEVEHYCPSYHSFWHKERDALEDRVDFLRRLASSSSL